MGFENMVNGFIKNNIIEKKDKDIYIHGLKHGVFMILNIISIIIIGILFNMLLESIIFILAYSPLRSYAGGYHADTILNCYIFSIALTIIAMISIKHIPPLNYTILFLTIVSAGLVFLLAPVESINKPLSKEERKQYKNIARIMCAIEIVIVVIFLIFNINSIALTISISLFVLALMLLFGKV